MGENFIGKKWEVRHRKILLNYVKKSLGTEEREPKSMSLCLKANPFCSFFFFLRVIFHISFGKQLDNTDQTP